jgi:SAM-dependent methyltransferase
MSHYEPKYPFDFDPSQYDNTDYSEMMEFIIRVESIQADGLGKWMIDNVPLDGAEGAKKKSVIDIGCGPGLYLLPYKEAGFEVHGIDACSAAGGLLDEGEFVRTDLRFPYTPAHRYNLAICFEVAEHLEEHWADRLVDTICDCADIVLFTGAVPGQGGTFHLNEQPHEYWLTKFKERHDYVLHPQHEAMRNFLEGYRALEATGEVSGWLINNSFLLHKEVSK